MADVENTPEQPEGPDKNEKAFDPAEYNPNEADDMDTTWGEVCRACCCHSPTVWVGIIIRLCFVSLFLYFFIMGLGILGDGAQVLTGCVSGALFGDDMNPISGLMVGILVTVCLQSSSTTTSIIVSLVGAGAISVDAAIYMVMGANVGTSVTNTIVAMGQMGDGDQLERAFAGATVHDMFNFLTVLVLMPIEVITSFLAIMTSAMVANVTTNPDGDTRESFVKKYISVVGYLMIIPNKNVVKAVAGGATCEDFYPTVCEDPSNPTYATCPVRGLITCSKTAGQPCPGLFQAGAVRDDDELGGLVAFLVGIVMLFVCLGGLVYVLQQMLLGGSTRVIYKATDINGYLAMVLGCLITMAVQSSSITTSTLTPLVGMGLVRLEQMLPLTLGANIGTTITSLMAALVTEGTDALQVALAHLFFNIFGIIIWYPIPIMRNVPLHAARQLGRATRAWKGFPIIYILFMFILLPVGLLGLSSLFGSGNTTAIAFGAILVALLGLFIIWFIWWWNWRQGRWITGQFFHKRQKKMDALETLPYDLTYLERKIKELQEHTQCEPAPAPTMSTDKDPRSAYVTVADDMDLANTMVHALIEHTGLPADEDTKGPNGEDLGRYVHLLKEPMPDVDTSGWMKYQLSVLAVAVLIFALAFWGIGKLLASDITSHRGMGGFLAIMVGLFYIYRAVCFFVWEGKEKSLKEYRDRAHKKNAGLTYIATLGQITADVDKLAAHTKLPALTAEEVGGFNTITASVRSEGGTGKTIETPAEDKEAVGDAEEEDPEVHA